MEPKRNGVLETTMIKRLLCLCLCICLLVSCGSQTNVSEPSGADGMPMDFSVSEQSGIKFSFESPEDSIYTMLYEPLSDAKVQAAFGICILDGYESDWTGDTDTTSSYAIYDPETKETFATVTVQTAPPDPKSYYGVTTDEEVLHEMQPSFFTAENFHAGLRKNIVEDFGYDLMIDWLGTAFGAPTGYLEFADPDSGTHSMRFYLCNDNLSEYFYSFTIRADVPAEDEEKIRDLRTMIFSLHIMDVLTDGNTEETGFTFE